LDIGTVNGIIDTFRKGFPCLPVIILCLWLTGCPGEDLSDIVTLADINSPAESDADVPDGDLQYQVKRNPGNVDSFSVVTDSNLFNKDREYIKGNDKSKKTPTPEPKQSHKEIKDLKLVGTMSLRDTESFAFIIDRKDKETKGKTLRYKTGDDIGQYSIASIRSDHVLLKSGDEVTILKLKASDSSKGQSSKSRRKGTKGSVGRGGTRSSDKSRDPAYNPDRRSGTRKAALGERERDKEKEERSGSVAKCGSGRRATGNRARACGR
jgi:hypothetical protein